MAVIFKLLLKYVGNIESTSEIRRHIFGSCRFLIHTWWLLGKDSSASILLSTSNIHLVDVTLCLGSVRIRLSHVIAVVFVLFENRILEA